jgi:hypothetical protein
MREQWTERWMVQAIDQRAIDGAMVDDGSGSNRRSYEWFKRWIREQ